MSLGARIRDARKSARLKAVEMAERIGVTPGAVSQWETDTAIPTMANIEGISRVTQCDLGWLITGSGLQPLGAKSSGARSNTPPIVEALNNRPAGAPLPSLPDTRIMPMDIEVRGTVMGDAVGNFTLSGVVEKIPRPPGIASLNPVHALRAPDSTMRPWRQVGEPVYYTTATAWPIREGDHVLVALKPARPGGSDGYCLRQLVKRTARSVTLAQYDPPSQTTMDTRKIADMYRVIEWREALGL